MSNAEDHLPPSAAYVRDIIQREGPIRRQELLDIIDMRERTVKWAVEQLKERDELETRPVPGDGRQVVYNIQT